MESIISTFHIDWKIIIAQGVNFGVVFVVLYIFALKPLSKLMNERSERISKGLTDAKNNAAMLALSKKDYEDAMLKARMEAQKVFEEGKKEAQTKRESMMAEAKAEVDAMIESGKKNLEMEKEKMIESVKGEIVTLAVQAAEKIIKEKVELKNL